MIAGRAAAKTAAAPEAPASAALASAALAAGTIVWAALPMSSASAGAKIALIVATCCAIIGLLQLAANIIAGRPRRAPGRAEHYVPMPTRMWRRTLTVLRTTPWPQAMIVAVVVLEALHPARPWHTAVLGVLLLCYLFALHLAESSARPTAMRPQLPLLTAGLGLAALSVGAAAVPAGGGSTLWLSVIAGIAAVIAAGLALPI